MKTMPLPPLPTDWEPTRAALHSYAQAVGVVARAHAVPHPKWWHVSLTVTPSGLVTDPMPTPSGDRFWIRMDLNRHAVFVESSGGDSVSIPMASQLSGSAFGDALLDRVAALGLDAKYETERYAGDEPHTYDPAHASSFFRVLNAVEHNLGILRVGLGGTVGPLQVWSHGFDLAFEWFGSGESQINFGFYPAGRAYFYSNPWPFDEGLLMNELPEPATWHTGDWQGTILYYDDLLTADDPESVLFEYTRAVYDLASPSLLD